MLRLRSLREEFGKTQTQIAALFNISRQVYANYENEINQPSLQLLIAMADYFQCSVDYLLGRTDDLGNINISSNPSLTNILTTEEQFLCKEFRQLSVTDKNILIEYACFLRERHNKK